MKAQAVVSAGAGSMCSMEDSETLTPEQRGVLDFEHRGTWRWQGAKESAIRETFRIGLTRYEQILNAAIDKHEAVALYPSMVLRLRRLRDARKAARSTYGANFSS